KTSSGKIQRRECRAGLAAGTLGEVFQSVLPEAEPVAAGYVAPRTDLERTIAAVWSDVLGVPRVGVHDGFFELGGHSLLATLTVSRLREALGIDISLRTLFEAPTVAALAAQVEAARQVGGLALDA